MAIQALSITLKQSGNENKRKIILLFLNLTRQVDSKDRLVSKSVQMNIKGNDLEYESKQVEDFSEDNVHPLISNDKNKIKTAR